MKTDSYLKVRNNVESETIVMNVSYFITLNSLVYLILWMNHLLRPDFIMSLGKCLFPELCISSKCWQFQYATTPQITSNITTHLIWKGFKYWETIKLTIVDTILSKFNFYLKAWFLLFATNNVGHFPWNHRLIVFSLPHNQVSIIIVCLFLIRVKNSVNWKNHGLT